MSKSTEFQQQQDAATKIETAVRSDDASQALYEASQDAAPYVQTEVGRQSINDRLIVDGEMWNSASEIFSPEALQELFPGQVATDEGLQKIADGTNPATGESVDPLQQLAAEAILEGKEKGLFGDNWTGSYQDEFNRLDAANTAIEVTTGLTGDEFQKFAGDDNALSAPEIKAALEAGVADPRQKEILQDLLRNMGTLNEQNAFQWALGQDQYVTFDGLKGKLQSNLAAEAQVIQQMTSEARVRLEAGGAKTDELPAPPPPADTEDKPAPELGAKEYVVASGDGFDRIARKLFMEQFGQRPSLRQELELSKYIAALNDNDRKYSGGQLRIGDTIQVPDFTGGDAAAFMEALRNAA